MPDQLLEECESLGLFTTRMPRFRQLFFYKFSQGEIWRCMGQATTSSSSRRAAETYLQSGIQLESVCGISDIWYWYVETHQNLFQDSTAEIALIPRPKPSHPRPHLDRWQADIMWNTFRWKKLHSRPRPTKKLPAQAVPLAASSPSNRPEHESSSQATQDMDGIFKHTRSKEVGFSFSSLREEGSSEGGSADEEDGSEGGLMDEGDGLEAGLMNEEGGSGDNFMDDEDCLGGGDTAAEVWGDGSGGSQESAVLVIKQESEYGDLGIEAWSMTSSFQSALGRTVDEAERATFVVLDGFPPSPIPEHKPRLSELSGLTSLVSVFGEAVPVTHTKSLAEVAEDPAEGVAEEDQMEGIELSQSSQSQVCSGVAGLSDPEITTGEDDGSSNTQSLEYMSDGKSKHPLLRLLMLIYLHSIYHGCTATVQS